MKPITLATLPTATAQEVFDWVVFNLRQQGAKSIKNGVCRYRGPNGLKCAAGWCIGDDEYDPRWDSDEGKNWRAISRDNDIHAHKQLIFNLQDVHDEYPVQEWENAWARAANRHGISYSLPQ